MKEIFLILCLGYFFLAGVEDCAGISVVSADPYVGAIVVDVATGEVILEDSADKQVYPASVIKLMDLLIILEKIEAGMLKLTDQVTVTAEAARIGGSQVYLKEKEVFTIDELLYALMIQSGNDAAAALAIHISGSTTGFIKLMNDRAAQLGMTSTKFNSVHGLPPSKGQEPDVSTARDIAKLAMEAVKRPAILRYTSTKERGFRNDTFIMRSHNRLMAGADAFPGCDGLKTGFFTAGGFSIAATAVRDDRRIIAVVAGSKTRVVRDAKARELLSYGFMNLPEIKPPEPEPVLVVEEPEVEKRSIWVPVKAFFRLVGKVLLVLVACAVVTGVVAGVFYIIKQRRESWKYKF